jgi:hypothetical protein
MPTPLRTARHSRFTAWCRSSPGRGKYQGRFHWPTSSNSAPAATCQVRAGLARGVEQLAALQAGKGAETDRQVVGPEGGGADLVDRLAHRARGQRHAVDVAQLALVGAETQCRVALDVFDRLEALADGQLDVAGRHVVLVVDKGLGAARDGLAGLGNPECGDGLLHRLLDLADLRGSGETGLRWPQRHRRGWHRPACGPGTRWRGRRPPSPARQWLSPGKTRGVLDPSAPCRRMRIQVDRRVPATRHADASSQDSVRCSPVALPPTWARTTMPLTEAVPVACSGTKPRSSSTPPRVPAPPACRRRCAHAHIDDADLCTRLPQHQRVGIGAVVVGQQHDALAHRTPYSAA